MRISFFEEEFRASGMKHQKEVDCQETIGFLQQVAFI